MSEDDQTQQLGRGARSKLNMAAMRPWIEVQAYRSLLANAELCHLDEGDPNFCSIAEAAVIAADELMKAQRRRHKILGWDPKRSNISDEQETENV